MKYKYGMMIDTTNLTWDLELVVPGNPKALKRHRSYQKGKFIGQYDPSQNDKADFLALAMKNRPNLPYDKALLVEYIFKFSRPKNHYRTGANQHLLKESAPYYHSSAPDVDNLEKFVNDALNGVYWKDDRIISETHVVKKYSNFPAITIRIKVLPVTEQIDILN